MEELGLFNKTITALADSIFQETSFRKSQQLLSKALSLGMPVNESYTQERSIFVITQIIITLIDEMVISERTHQREFVKREFLKEEVGSKSTLNSSPKCLLGNLNIAVLLYQMFCPKMVIWDIIEKMTSIKKELQQQQGIFEVVHLSNRIFQIQNFNNNPETYKCYCEILKGAHEKMESINCHHCLKEFHPGCQYNPLFCNGCYLRFCLVDLSEEVNDPFNCNKDVRASFFGYIPNWLEDQSNELPENIYFHVVRFSLDNFSQQADRKQKYVQIRLCVVDKVFPEELVLPQKMGFRPKKETNWFWALDNIQYYFYLNHNQIKYTSDISKHCITIKVPHRILEKSNNVLVIKSVKRNQRYQIKDSSVLTYWTNKQSAPKILMIGVYEITRKKVKGGKGNIEIRDPSPNVLPAITLYQSYHFLQFVEKKINQVPFQIATLYNCGGAKKIQHPVRSFGCHHIECFDYLQFKETLKAPKVRQKIARKSYSRNRQSEVENCIEINSHSESVVEVPELQGQKQEVEGSKSVQTQPLTLPFPPTKLIHKTQSLQLGKKKKKSCQVQGERELLCPICQRRLLILYSDPLFKQIIFNSGFYKKVKILSNGQYTFQEITKQGSGLEAIEIQ